MDFGISDMYGQGEERGATMSHSKGSIMVLGCISVSGVEDLLKLDELEKKHTIRFLQYMQHNLETIRLATYSVFRKNMMRKTQ